MGSQEAPNPRHVITDISDVSGAKSFERQNTITLTKKTEVRSKTFMAVIGGGGVGLALTLCTYWALSLFSFFFPLLGAILAPFLFVGQTKDGAGITRWRRLNDKWRSKDKHGKLFFPNSQRPVELTETKLIIITNHK